MNFKPYVVTYGAGDKMKGYGVKLACKPYPFVLDPADVSRREIYADIELAICFKSFCQAFFKKRKNDLN